MRHRVKCVGARSALWLAAALPLAYADSGPRVHRCIGPHGEIAFSDVPCATAATTAGTDPATAPAPPVQACAASGAELEERIGAALARRDANALAGLLHWRGVGAGEVAQRLRALRELVERPLLAIEADVAQEDDGLAGVSDGLRVRTGGADTGGVREQVFGVNADGVCYWLTW